MPGHWSFFGPPFSDHSQDARTCRLLLSQDVHIMNIWIILQVTLEIRRSTAIWCNPKEKVLKASVRDLRSYRTKICSIGLIWFQLLTLFCAKFLQVLDTSSFFEVEISSVGVLGALRSVLSCNGQNTAVRHCNDKVEIGSSWRQARNGESKDKTAKTCWAATLGTWHSGAAA